MPKKRGKIKKKKDAPLVSSDEALACGLEIFFNNGGEITREGLYVPLPINDAGRASYAAYLFLQKKHPEVIPYLHGRFLKGEIDNVGVDIVNLRGGPGGWPHSSR